jgi:hypothetical protein
MARCMRARVTLPDTVKRDARADACFSVDQLVDITKKIRATL